MLLEYYSDSLTTGKRFLVRRVCVLVSWGLCNKVLKTGGAENNRNSYCPTILEAQVQNQGVSMALFSPKAQGPNPSLFLVASGVCRQSLTSVGF